VDWHEYPADYEAVEVRSVGYIIEKSEGVVLVPNVIQEQASSDFQCFGLVSIPRGCITAIEYLEVRP